jgi:hypothetical protein
MGSTFLGDGNPIKPGGPLAAELCGLWPSRIGLCGLAVDLANAGGGGPINRDTVHGSSNLAAPAHAIYRASSRCKVG